MDGLVTAERGRGLGTRPTAHAGAGRRCRAPRPFAVRLRCPAGGACGRGVGLSPRFAAPGASPLGGRSAAPAVPRRPVLPDPVRSRRRSCPGYGLSVVTVSRGSVPWVPVLRPPSPEQPPVRSALTLRSASRATSSHRREVRVGPASRRQTRWTPAAPRRPESPHWGPESVSPLGHVSCNIRRYGFALFPRGAPWQPRRSPIPTAAEDGCRFLLQLRTNLRRSSHWRLSSSCGTTAPRCETESTTSSSTRWAAPRPRASGPAHGAHLGEAVPIPQAQPPAAPGEGESRARRARVHRQALEKP